MHFRLGKDPVWAQWTDRFKVIHEKTMLLDNEANQEHWWEQTCQL